jgi:hypothetical protein
VADAVHLIAALANTPGCMVLRLERELGANHAGTRLLALASLKMSW